MNEEKFDSQTHCIEKTSIRDLPLPNDENLVVIVSPTEQLIYHCYLLSDIVLMNKRVVPFTIRENVESDNPKPILPPLFILQLFLTGQWLTPESSFLLVGSNKRYFAIYPDERARIGTMYGFGRTHGAMTQLYKLVPIRLHQTLNEKKIVRDDTAPVFSYESMRDWIVANGLVSLDEYKEDYVGEIEDAVIALRELGLPHDQTYVPQSPLQDEDEEDEDEEDEEDEQELANERFLQAVSNGDARTCELFIRDTDDETKLQGLLSANQNRFNNCADVILAYGIFMPDNLLESMITGRHDVSRAILYNYVFNYITFFSPENSGELIDKIINICIRDNSSLVLRNIIYMIQDYPSLRRIRIMWVILSVQACSQECFLILWGYLDDETKRTFWRAGIGLEPLAKGCSGLIRILVDFGMPATYSMYEFVITSSLQRNVKHELLEELVRANNSQELLERQGDQLLLMALRERDFRSLRILANNGANVSREVRQFASNEGYDIDRLARRS